MLPDRVNSWQQGQYTYELLRQQEMARFLRRFFRGCGLTWVDADTVSIGAGLVWLSGKAAQNAAAIQIELSDANDRESGVTETVSTWYYVYARQSRSDDTAFECYFSTSAPVVELHGEDVYLGRIYNDAAGDLDHDSLVPSGAAGAGVTAVWGAVRVGAWLTWVDADNVAVGAGSLVFQDKVRSSTGQMIDLSIASDREADVDDTVSTWYYVYAKPDPSNDNAYVCFYSTTQPTLGQSGRHPTENWVYLGSVYNDAASVILRFRQNGKLFLFITPQSIYAGTVMGPAGPSNVTAVVPPGCVGHFLIYHSVYNPNITSAQLLFVYSLPTAAASFWSSVGSITAGYAMNTVTGMAQANSSSQIQVEVIASGWSTPPTVCAQNVYSIGYDDAFLP